MYLSVKDYGAVGDGVADDAPEIQATINAAAQLNSEDGGIYFPRGRYKIYNSLSWPASINGRGGMGVPQHNASIPEIIWGGPPGDNMINILPDATGAAAWLLFDQLAFAGMLSAGRIIDFPGTTDIGTNFNRCKFHGATNDAIRIHGVTNLHLRETRFDQVYPYALRIESNSMLLVIDDFTWDNGGVNADGFLFLGGDVGQCYIQIGNGRLEINTPLVGEKGLITLEATRNEPDYVKLLLQNLWAPGPYTPEHRDSAWVSFVQDKPEYADITFQHIYGRPKDLIRGVSGGPHEASSDWHFEGEQLALYKDGQLTRYPK